MTKRDGGTEVIAPTQPGEEFSSVTITIDHLLLNDPADKTVVKTVWSTETAHESLLAQSGYFDQKNGGGLNLADPSIFRTVGQGLDADVAYVYVVNEYQTNVVVDAGLWKATIENPHLGGNTVLGTVSAFIVMATEMVKAARAAGIPARLFAFVPSAAEVQLKVA